MFRFLADIAGIVMVPSNLLVGLGLVGAVLLLGGAGRFGAGAMLAACSGLALAGFSPLPNLLLAPLEARFPAIAEDAPAPDGIVVLGGALSLGVRQAGGLPAVNESAERMFAMAALARRYPSARLVFSGGGRGEDGASEADLAARLMAALGIAPERFHLEGRSRNTAQNARYTAALAAPKEGETWWLVTSAYHMPRAMGAFRAAGFEAIAAYPVDYRVGAAGAGFSTLSSGLARLDVAAREWLGLAAYYASGRTARLFPAP